MSDLQDKLNESIQQEYKVSRRKWKFPGIRRWLTKRLRCDMMMLGAKDALRIVPYFVLPQSCPIFAYREADAPLLCSYRAGH